MSHATQDDAALTDDEADAIAEITQALATPSRVRLLYALRDSEQSVTDLADATGMTVQAASQQLRVLRHLKLVISQRDGRTMLYRLHDEHVASLLDEVRGHARHVTLNLPDHTVAASRAHATPTTG
jgi:DNA-binding transcriptional ArsR family regulator